MLLNPMKPLFSVDNAFRDLHRLLKGVFAISFLAIGTWASAEDDRQHAHDHEHPAEHRQHGVHVHGVATLNLALDGTAIQIELHSPAANIVGFEHAPATEAQHATLDKAVARLQDGDTLYQFNDEAGCRMEEATVTSELLDPQHQEPHAHDGETHSDIAAAYQFVCDAPDQVTRLTLGLFDAFAGMEEIEVQYVIESRQGAAELTAKNPVVQFRGASSR